MGLEKPHGIRSCGAYGERGRGGTWEPVRINGGRAPFYREIESFKARLTASMRKLFNEDMGKLMGQPEAGTATFGKHELVDFMACTRDVLELRLGDWAAGPLQTHVRLYYTEPTEEPSVLLILKFAWKMPGPAELEQQNEDAREAQLRYDEWQSNR